MLPPSTSLPVMGEIAGVNMASLAGYLHSTKTRARWVKGFRELNGHMFDLEMNGLCQAVLSSRLTMQRQHTTIPDQISCRPGQQGPCLSPNTRTEVSNVLLVNHLRFKEETSSQSALGTTSTATGKPSAQGQSLSTSQQYKHTLQHQTMTTTKYKNSMTNYRMSLIRHRRRTFLWYK